MQETALSLMMLAIPALLAGAVFLWRRGERKRPALMLVLAAVMAGNIAILLVPGEGGRSVVGTGAGPAPAPSR